MINKTLLIIAFFGVACAHEEVAPVHGAVKGVHIHAPEIFKLTKDDVLKIDRALQSSSVTNLTLSGDLKAECENHLCHFKGKNFQGDFTPGDFQKFSSTLKKAQKSQKEESLVEGPITLKCLPKSCAVDFNLDDDQTREFSGSVKVKTDYTGSLLGSFIGGMVGAGFR